MREIILPVPSPVSPRRSTDQASPDDDEVIGCLPRLFATSHKAEVDRLVDSIPSLETENAREAALERYMKLLDLYQEQPSLLDCAVPSLLARLLAMVKLPAAGDVKRLDRQSGIAMHFAFHLSKVRGHKVMMRQLPHDVHYLAPLLSCLAAYQDTPGMVLHEEMMLLMWLTIVAKNPFDLRRFDGKAAEGATMRRIFAIAMPYLDRSWNRTHHATALLLAECIARLDGHSLIGPTIDTALQRMQDALAGAALGEGSASRATTSDGAAAMKLTREVSDKLIGTLILLLAILKKVDRSLLLPYAKRICDCTQRFFPLHPSDDSLLKKCLIKVIQRLALITLRPKLAKWRYTRGKRRLEENLQLLEPSAEQGAEQTNGKSATEDGGQGDGIYGTDRTLSGSTSATSGGVAAKKQRRGRGLEKREETEDEEDVDIDAAMMSWILDYLIRALADNDTNVRWSAAKGVGRVCSRLPEALATQVVQNVLQTKFHRLAGNCSWHGGCLALAELSRRGCLLPPLLPQAFDVVRAALFFQEPTGKFALGSNVRDAACYVVWAWARAYEAAELADHVAEMATALMCVALFDREVSIRRAASAAFQENVGRQRTFPDGIALLTISDYFAVGNRARCYSTLAVEVAAFPKYRRALIDHLVEQKVTHWDEVVREQAAGCLGRLCQADPEYLRDRLVSVLLPGMATANVMDRHGFVVAAASVYAGLRKVVEGGREEEGKEVVATLSALPNQLRSACLASARGCEMAKRTATEAMRILAEAELPLTREQVLDWLSLLYTLASADVGPMKTTDRTAENTYESGIPFFRNYINADEGLVAHAATLFVQHIASARLQGGRTGACLLAALLPPHTFCAHPALLDAVAATVEKRTELDTLWADARRAAARAVATAGRSPGLCAAAFRLLLVATDDYTMDRKCGDIGRPVREEAMRGVAALATLGGLTAAQVEEATVRLAQLSAERIAKTRLVSCECLQQMLRTESVAAAMPSRGLLEQVYKEPKQFESDACLESLLPLFACDKLLPALLQSLVLSAGGVSEGTTLAATRAITEFLEATDQQGRQEFVGLLAELLTDFRSRVSLAALQVLPTLIPATRCLESNPDGCAPLQRITATLVISMQKAKQTSRIRHTLASCSVLLSARRGSQVWRAAADCCVKGLQSALPAVRRMASEALYEGLCVAAATVAEGATEEAGMTEEEDELLATLAETPWAETDDPEGLARATRQVIDFLS